MEIIQFMVTFPKKFELNEKKERNAFLEKIFTQLIKFTLKIQVSWTNQLRNNRFTF